VHGGTEVEQRVADFCCRVAGADALLTSRAARGVCYTPAYTIMGGTTNILRNIVGERILGLPREPRLSSLTISQNRAPGGTG